MLTVRVVQASIRRRRCSLVLLGLLMLSFMTSIERAIYSTTDVIMSIASRDAWNT